MSLGPPGLSAGGGSRTGPPPGFGNGAFSTGAGGGGGGGEGRGQDSSALAIVKAQIVFLLSSLTEESYERTSKELKTVGLTH